MVALSSLQSPVLPRKMGKCLASNVQHSRGYCGSNHCNSTQACFWDCFVETLLQAISGLSFCHPDINQYPAPCKCWRHGDGLATEGPNASMAAGWRHCTHRSHPRQAGVSGKASSEPAFHPQPRWHSWTRGLRRTQGRWIVTNSYSLGLPRMKQQSC